MLAIRNAAAVARELWAERRFAEMARRGAGLTGAGLTGAGLMGAGALGTGSFPTRGGAGATGWGVWT